MKNDFGKWITDEYGLPAFAYTLDQYKYKDKCPMNNPVFNKKNDHYAQIGNDRLVAIPSNYGFIRVRQDEGGPKFLNDYDEANNEYGGGFGYLVYDDNILSTYYLPNSQMERVFGAGYFRKVISDQNFKIEQKIYAPYGDDPVLKDDIKITNLTDNKIKITYYEYFGNAMLQFSSRGYNTLQLGKEINRESDESHNVSEDHIEVAEKDKTATLLEFRRQFDKNFSKNYATKDGIMLCKRQFQGFHYPENIGRVNEAFPPIKDNQTSEDLCPPITFFTSCHHYEDTYIYNTKQFFSGNLERPYGIDNELDDHKTGYIIKTTVTIEPNQSVTLNYLYGYTNNIDSIEKYKDKYAHYTLENSLNDLKNKVITCKMKDPRITRETLWNSIYLRQSLTFDSYFNEHILSQGGYYQYIWGIQAAVRDPLQHCLPFIFTESKYTKEVIRYTLKQILPDGTVPWATTGFGMEYSGGFAASDQELYIIWTICEYVLGTKDYEFLEEVIEPAYKDGKKRTVIGYLKLCLDHFINEIGLGEHGLVRICSGDWSDSILRENVLPEKREEAFKYAESGFNTAMCIYTMDIFAKLMHHIDHKLEQEAIDFKNSQIEKVLEWWNGKWFPRAILGDMIVGGDEELWLEPQTWLLIAKVLPKQEAMKLIDTIEKYCIEPSPIGAKKRHRFLEEEYRMKHTDGVWWAINGLLIWGLQKYKQQTAILEWKKNSFYCHEENYPDIWYGIWSASDAYESVTSRYPGHIRYNPAVLKANLENRPTTGTGLNDFPVNVIHQHAWPLYSLMKLTGLEFTYDGFSLENVPSEELEVDSPLYSYHYDGKQIQVSYNPKGKEMNRVELIDIPYKTLLIDGVKVNGNEILLPNTSVLTIEL